MSNSELSSAIPDPQEPRKPRVAIMGEFSVGKSTLSNLLIGSSPLPVKVTATQLPPVWMSYGDQAAYREDLEGNVIPVDLERLDQVPLDSTSVVRVFLKSDILELCDLIDMPGISDPNMSAEVWQRVLHKADGVLWCTHATQAWRQSEAAVWKSMPPEIFAKSFLLITRIDKLLTEADRQKVVKRVRRETQGLFAELFPISLTEALAGQEDRDLWELSGAEAFTQSLVDLTHELSQALGYSPNDRLGGPSRLAPETAVEQSVEPDTAADLGDASTAPDSKVHRLGVAPKKEESNQPEVVPTRVKVASASGRATPRPAQGKSPAVAASFASDVQAGGQHDREQPSSGQERL